MTSTLFRHEFLRTRPALATAYAVAVVTTAVAALLRLSGVTLLETLGVVLATLAGPGLVVAVDAVLAVDYWRTGYGREGYFTHTLPIAPRTIFAVRLTYGLLVTAVTTLVAAALCLAPLAVGSDGTALLAPLRSAAAAHPGVAVLAGLGMVVLSWFYLAQLYFAASIGSEGRLGALGVGGPVLVWFAAYLGTQALGGLALFALPWGLRLAGGGLAVERYSLALHSGSQDIGFPLGVVAVFLVTMIVLIARTAHSWAHKVSLR